MAKTVNSAFDYFLANYVNLDKDQSSLAKSSRNWLVAQIHAFERRIPDFPVLYSNMDVFFGSFDRKTKKRELDDIDIIIALHAQGSTHYNYPDRVELIAPDTSPILKKYCHEYTNKINSKKIINKFVSSLSSVPHYQKADIRRNQESAVLNLLSYAWSFDIVPSFFTTPDYYGNTCYLIPDGKGHWKKTDPRIDKARVSSINQKHAGNVLNVIRIMKYWNNRATMPSMGSYLLENMILNYYASQSFPASSYVDLEVGSVLNYIHSAVYYAVNDPKGIQGDLNNLSADEKYKISYRSALDYGKAVEARKFEDLNNHESAIKKWTEIFGVFFPSYG